MSTVIWVPVQIASDLVTLKKPHRYCLGQMPNLSLLCTQSVREIPPGNVLTGHRMMVMLESVYNAMSLMRLLGGRLLLTGSLLLILVIVLLSHWGTGYPSLKPGSAIWSPVVVQVLPKSPPVTVVDVVNGVSSTVATSGFSYDGNVNVVREPVISTSSSKGTGQVEFSVRKFALEPDTSLSTENSVPVMPSFLDVSGGDVTRGGPVLHHVNTIQCNFQKYGGENFAFKINGG